MPDILVRGLEVRVIKRLKEMACDNGRSLQGEVKEILSRNVPYTMKEALQVSQKWKKRFAGRKFSDSTLDIRKDRDSR